jgi:hypothetical protein
MYYGDYGNYETRFFERKSSFEFQRAGGDKKVSTNNTPKPSAQTNTPILSFGDKTKSTDALAAYAKASFNIAQKVTASALPLNNEAQAIVSGYFTPEQEQRVSENMLKYFAG